jgi:uncharacterized protein (TIGR02145 family)
VYDNRDDEGYYIQKLDDGKCWLLENLRLDTTLLKTPLTTENTNMSPDVPFTLPLSFDEYGSNNFEIYTSPQLYLGYEYDTMYNDLPFYNHDDRSDGIGYAGIYYNYCAATAGTYCDDSSSGSGNAEYDICPAGWRLPTGGQSGEYNTLYSTINDSGEFQEKLRIVKPGYFYGKTYHDHDFFSREHFWTSTGYGAANVSTVTVLGDNVYPADYHNRDYGFNIRCVAK